MSLIMLSPRGSLNCLFMHVADVEGDRSSPMSIEELVDFLLGERVAVIRVPPEREYVNYFVTCMGWDWEVDTFREWPTTWLLR